MLVALFVSWNATAVGEYMAQVAVYTVSYSTWQGGPCDARGVVGG